jgi:hypothetical protein
MVWPPGHTPFSHSCEWALGLRGECLGNETRLFFNSSASRYLQRQEHQRPRREQKEEKKKAGMAESEITTGSFFREVGGMDQSTFELAIGRELALQGRSLMADRAVCLIKF